MGLSSWLARRATGAAHVLVVEAPGRVEVRAAVERAVARRGWQPAESPAGADVLVLAGELPVSYEEPVARVWDSLPGPRARVQVTAVDEVEEALAHAARLLRDDHLQAGDAVQRTGFEAVQRDHGTDHGTDHEGMDHEGMDHEGMDHGGMDMDMAPSGIPLAPGDPEDRDGLEMDALPVRLGPVLVHWPAGLVLDVTLHGDLVVHAHASWLDPGAVGAAPDVELLGLVGAVSDLLALAGCSRGAAVAARVRDSVLDGRSDDAATALEGLRRELRRARLLRWALRGVGAVSVEQAQALHLPDPVVGDAHSRLLAAVEVLAQHLANRSGGTGAAGTDGRQHGRRAAAGEPGHGLLPVESLGPLLEGCDLAVVRLVVASLGPWLVPVGVAARA